MAKRSQDDIKIIARDLMILPASDRFASSTHEDRSQ
jgi:hypothetical protein